MDKKWLYGRAVVNGVPQFLSVSRLTGADESEGGCLRAWFYDMVVGRKRPPTRASKRGDDAHAELEKYLKTGDRSLSSLVLKGMHMVPDPIKYDAQGRPDMLVEHDLVRLPLDPEPADELAARALLARAPLTADGIPVLGRIDLVHGRLTNRGTPNVEDAIDPPGTVEVLDWKTTGTPEYIKQAKQLPGLIQMAGYGEWVFRVEPDATSVRLSHGYFVERGGPCRKVSLRVLRDDVAKTWEHAEVVARRIRHAAAETDADKIDANLAACDRYGGCFHKEVCKARMHQALTAFVGKTAADKLVGKQETDSMGLLDKMKGAAAPQGAAPAITPPATPVAAVTQTKTETSVTLGIGALLGAPTAPAGPDPAALAAEKAKLEAEEAALRAQQQLKQAADAITPLLAKIRGYAKANPEIGMPTFVGIAAMAHNAAIGETVSTETKMKVEGSGKLAGVELDSIAKVEEFCAQLDQLAAANQIQPANRETFTPPASVVQPKPEEKPAEAKLEPAPEAKVDPKPEEKKVATRKKKDSASDQEADLRFSIFVDCQFEAPGDAKSFHPIFDALCAELASLTSDLDLRAAGLRAGADGKLVKEDTALSYGRADGAIAALVRERPIEPGTYYFSTRGNRIAEVVVDALRDRCRKTGGIHAWGNR